MIKVIVTKTSLVSGITSFASIEAPVQDQDAIKNALRQINLNEAELIKRTSASEIHSNMFKPYVSEFYTTSEQTILVSVISYSI